MSDNRPVDVRRRSVVKECERSQDDDRGREGMIVNTQTVESVVQLGFSRLASICASPIFCPLSGYFLSYFERLAFLKRLESSGTNLRPFLLLSSRLSCA